MKTIILTSTTGSIFVPTDNKESTTVTFKVIKRRKDPYVEEWYTKKSIELSYIGLSDYMVNTLLDLALRTKARDIQHAKKHVKSYLETEKTIRLSQEEILKVIDLLF